MATVLQTALQEIALGTQLGGFLALIALLGAAIPIIALVKRKEKIEVSKLTWTAVLTAVILYIANTLSLSGIVGVLFQIVTTFMIGYLVGAGLAFLGSEVETLSK